MRALRAFSLGIVCGFVPLCLTLDGRAAADDGVTGTLVCAATEATQCQEAEACIQGPAGKFSLPSMFKIDFQKKAVESLLEGGERRTSPIDRLEKKGDSIILQGSDEATAWIATIQASNGGMTVAAAREGQAFVVFGACTRL